MNELKLSLFQMNIIYEDKAANLKTLEECLKLDMIKDADILLLPEMSFTGFSMNTEVTKEVCSSIEDSKTVKNVAIMAKEAGISIGFGWVRGYEDSLSENHYTIVDMDGKVVLDYVKIHPFSYSGEDKYFKGGKKLITSIINEMEIGASICYDLRFGYLYEKLSEKSHMILVPANWPKKRVMHYNALLKARAIENQVYMVGINCMGEIGGLSYSGDSGIYGPDGKVVEATCCMDFRGGKLMNYTISDTADAVREAFPVRNDRIDITQF